MPKLYTIDDVLYLMSRLRDPNDGCPWDIKQNYNDIVPYTIEECYELADALANGDMEHAEEELGDVLFQVIFYAQLGLEDQYFNFHSIVHKLVEKLVRRHPHVFPEENLYKRYGNQFKDTDAIKANWENIKKEERQAKKKQSVLADVPLALPALSRAQKLQKRAASVGMDWHSVGPVVEMLRSELKELQEAMEAENKLHIKEEAGDVLFAAVNLVRHLKLDAETTLRDANTKFTKRIECMESLCQEQGASLIDLDEAALDVLWKQAKNQLAR